MFDDISADGVPTGGDLYAGYDDGHWPDADALAARFPGIRVVRITVFPSDNQGDVLDVELGDATPAQAPDWLRRRRAAGAWPTLYVNLSNWSAAASAVAAAGLEQPPYWVAYYPTVLPSGVPSIPSDWAVKGVVAWQYLNTKNYDASAVADYWPGIDPHPQGDHMLVTDDDKREYVRSLVQELWGRELASADEQTYLVSYLTANGKDLTRAAVYDHQNARDFRAKRGW